jgi:hypothetical protein
MSRATYALLERMPLPRDTATGDCTAPMTLRAVLGGLALQPFSAASVARYKQEKTKEANAWLWLHQAASYLPHLCFGVCVADICLIAVSATMPPGVAAAWCPPWLSGAASMLIMLVSGVMLAIVSVVEVKDRAVWEIVQHPEYGDAIPDTVLLNLCEIKANLPTVAFLVHRLVQNSKGLDPFMEARYGDESYFIAVWDETYAA